MEDEQEPEEEPCSTSVTGDEEPLLCPHGYVCHIVEAGSPDKGVPNSGVCKKIDRKDRPTSNHHHHRGHGKCSINGDNYHHGDSFFYQTYKCTCRHGRIQCEEQK
ncbi:WAP four-disulfide core domain protein 1-like [Lingula anatina]|uniref:WAP four-disulfide core domain protein 1-like n=1 Tax=Lingula anatina TaxID=7574 RepID=A0A1S3HG28_LINAN|nr:WAP four-disulfide core domain protein 1-like [Lingula anatina]|eukprot:XP_013384436.2 WAP four-disulfide core domain protein 1-like [Lingula anatina]